MKENGATDPKKGMKRASYCRKRPWCIKGDPDLFGLWTWRGSRQETQKSWSLDPKESTRGCRAKKCKRMTKYLAPLKSEP